MVFINIPKVYSSVWRLLFNMTSYVWLGVETSADTALGVHFRASEHISFSGAPGDTHERRRSWSVTAGLVGGSL